MVLVGYGQSCKCNWVSDLTNQVRISSYTGVKADLIERIDKHYDKLAEQGLGAAGAGVVHQQQPQMHSPQAAAAAAGVLTITQLTWKQGVAQCCLV